jgi:hypothetical protein
MGQKVVMSAAREAGATIVAILLALGAAAVVVTLLALAVATIMAVMLMLVAGPTLAKGRSPFGRSSPYKSSDRYFLDGRSRDYHSFIRPRKNEVLTP